MFKSHNSDRFLSEADCVKLAQRLAELKKPNEEIWVNVFTTWTSYVRWGRNEIIISADTRDHQISLFRQRNRDIGSITFNQVDEDALTKAAQRVERLMIPGAWDFSGSSRGLRPQIIEDSPRPEIWDDATYNLTADHMSDVVNGLIQYSRDADMLSAGYLEVSARGFAALDGEARALYYPSTAAQFTVTVRDPDATGSGWAGRDDYAWNRLGAEALTQRAIEKCIRSKNPVAVEPGRYMTILEPQAVSQLLDPLFRAGMERYLIEESPNPLQQGLERDWDMFVSKLGVRIFDERISIRSDPMDKDTGFWPFDGNGEVYHAAEWIRNGVLVNLPYEGWNYGITWLGKTTPLPFSGAYRVDVHGPSVSVDEMIATTKRGILVTRFSNVNVVDDRTLLTSGYTRDGTWLIENGQITKPIKNLRFLDSPMYVFNQVEQLGTPERVYRPITGVQFGGDRLRWSGGAALLPAVKVRDFSFTHLFDAV